MNVIAELVSRCIPVDATPADKATRYHEIAAAVRKAGSYAEPAWLLTREGSGDALAAFVVQVEALRATVPKVEEQPTQRRRGTIRRSSVLDGL